MSIKENVAQAWKEIIGVVKVDEETEQRGDSGDCRFFV